LTVITKV